MKSIFSCLIASITLFSSAQAKEPPAFSRSTEMIVVTTGDWSSPQGALRRYERQRPGTRWKVVGEPITVMVGKNGLGWGSGVLTPKASSREAFDPVKKEGDGKAPAGVFRLGKAFGYAAEEQPGWKMPYVSLTPSIECVDEEKSKFYNTLVDTVAISADWGSHENERMRRSDELYRWGIFVDHNANPPVAGAGSCIFMHIWRGPGQPTVGCTAMAQPDLESVLGWLDPDRQPLLVQLPAAEYHKLHGRWHLPAIASKGRCGDTTMQSGRKSDNRN
jgi:L,D-peptidoglycan transpeptidase YkuD (ErfK/YbiS/YcfS/YnhG family)